MTMDPESEFFEEGKHNFPEYVNCQHINTYSHSLDILCYLEQLGQF